MHMEAKQNGSTEWVVVRLEPAEREPVETPLGLRFVLKKNVRSGKLRLDVHMPNPEDLRLPQDLGVLLHNFGWVVAALCMELRTSKGGKHYETWHDCCQVLNKVDYALKL